MGYNVQYLDTAKNDLTEIKAVLSAYSHDFMAKTINAILDSVEHLKENPLMYEAYRKDKRYRRIPIAEYIVLYRVKERTKQVEIMRVVYGRRNYKKTK